MTASRRPLLGPDSYLAGLERRQAEPPEVRALSLWQPWASLIAVGAKTIETRSWSTPYRGLLAVHAAKRRVPRLGEAPAAWAALPAGTYEATRSEENPTRFPPDGQDREPLPRGAVVAVARLVDVVPIVAAGSFVGRTVGVLGPGLWEWHPPQAGGRPTDRGGSWHDRTSDLPFGDYTPGRFAWLLDEIRSLDRPVPLRGRQGLWRLPPPVAAEILAAVDRNQYARR